MKRLVLGLALLVGSTACGGEGDEDQEWVMTEDGIWVYVPPENKENDDDDEVQQGMCDPDDDECGGVPTGFRPNGRRLNAATHRDLSETGALAVEAPFACGDRCAVSLPGGEVLELERSSGAAYRANVPLCEDGRDVVLISGAWDARSGGKLEAPNMITFACRGFALAKCAEAGFDGKLHEACVRAMRADYCGDGRSWTVDGTMISFGGEGELEAVWTARGAIVRDGARVAAPDCGPVADDGTLPLLATYLSPS